MKAKHTPGPWTKVFLNGHWHVAGFNGRVEVAKVSAHKDRNATTANAKLIECAPELLEALEQTVAHLYRIREEDERIVIENGPDDERFNLCNIQGLIAKAKGESK